MGWEDATEVKRIELSEQEVKVFVRILNTYYAYSNLLKDEDLNDDEGENAKHLDQFLYNLQMILKDRYFEDLGPGEYVEFDPFINLLMDSPPNEIVLYHSQQLQEQQEKEEEEFKERYGEGLTIADTLDVFSDE
jgi:hypothetical protein